MVEQMAQTLAANNIPEKMAEVPAEKIVESLPTVSQILEC
jgi:hypothetical protein